VNAADDAVPPLPGAAVEIARVVRAFPTLLRIGVAEVVAYRAEFLVWILTTNMPLVMLALWHAVTNENLFTTTDYAGFKREFRELFGFEVPGIDYAQPVDIDVPLNAA